MPEAVSNTTNSTPNFLTRQLTIDNKLINVTLAVMSVALLVFACMQLCGNGLPFSDQTFAFMALGFSAIALTFYLSCAYLEHNKASQAQNVKDKSLAKERSEKACGYALVAAAVLSLAISTLTGSLNVQQMSLGLVVINAVCFYAVSLEMAIEKGKKRGFKDGQLLHYENFSRQNTLKPGQFGQLFSATASPLTPPRKDPLVAEGMPSLDESSNPPSPVATPRVRNSTKPRRPMEAYGNATLTRDAIAALNLGGETTFADTPRAADN